MTRVAYFDETGHSSEAEYVAVAGLVAEAEAWEGFRQLWLAACTAEGVSGFHARHYVHSRGDFASWKGDETRRRRYMGALLEAIRTARPTPVGAIVHAASVRELPPEVRLRMKDPYCHCVQAAVRVAALCDETIADRGSVNMVIARSSERTGDAMALVRLMKRSADCKGRIGTLSIMNASDTPELQAADLWAYEMYRETQRRHHSSTTKARHPYHLFAWLMSGLPLVHFFDTPWLSRIYGRRA